MNLTEERRLVGEAAGALAEFFGDAPPWAVVQGSGIAFSVGEPAASLSFHDVPNWPAPSTPGHGAEVRLEETPGGGAAVLTGRVHLYEGLTPLDAVRMTRTLARWGVKNLFLTNSSGGIAEGLAPGSLLLVSDHLNLTGASPLAGDSDRPFGPRFLDCTELYDPSLRRAAREAARELGLSLAEGVYAAVRGPQYETPAEVRMLAALGADAVGMSTALEALAARQGGMRVLALSLVTNRAAGLGEGPITHEEVTLQSEKAAPALGRLAGAVIGAVGGGEP